MDYVDLIKAFGVFFAIMNPFVNLSMFLALTTDLSEKQKQTLAIKIFISTFIMCATILFAGNEIISFFGITVDQFRIAGGLVLAHIAWTMLNGEENSAHHGSDIKEPAVINLSSFAFYPITFPMIVGPGSIATLIIYNSQAQAFHETLAIGCVVAFVLFILFVVLFFASYFSKVFTDTMHVIMKRIMGIILLAISVAMVIDGIKAIFPNLA